MKLLIHVNLSPRWAIPLAKIGVHATHWSTLGPGSAADKVIFAFAARNGYVILTNDLDFGALLAATNATSPSLIQLRMYNVNSDVAGPTVMDTISKTAPQLDLGALVTIQEYRLRVASLPLGHSL